MFLESVVLVERSKINPGQDSPDPVELLVGLLEQESPSGDESQAVDYLVQAMSHRGFRSRVDGAGNAVGILGNGPREILLLGHTDTLPGPIAVRREGERLFGRGVVAGKGSLAMLVEAAARTRIPAGWRLVVIGSVGKEADGCGTRYICEYRRPPSMVIIGEASGWDRLGMGNKGILGLRYSVRKKLASTAAKRLSAFETTLRFWNNLIQMTSEYNLPYARAFDQLTPTLVELDFHVDGGFEVSNLRAGMHLPPKIVPGELASRIYKRTGAGTIEIEDRLPAFRAEKNTPLVHAFVAAIRQQNGRPGFMLKSGASDMNLVGPAWKCPVVAYGPGDTSMEYAEDENILLSEYRDSIKVLSSTLERAMQR
jgi:LysW-gamma-L-lysine carboxypeptidase